MQPSSYISTPRHVLQTVIQNADRVGRQLLEKNLSIDTRGAKLAAMSGSIEPTPLAPMAAMSGAAALLAEADEALEDAEVLGNANENAAVTAESVEALGASLQQLQAATEGPQVVVLQDQEEHRLQESAAAVAVVVVSRASGREEAIAEKELPFVSRQCSALRRCKQIPRLKLCGSS